MYSLACVDCSSLVNANADSVGSAEDLDESSLMKKISEELSSKTFIHVWDHLIHSTVIHEVSSLFMDTSCLIKLTIFLAHSYVPMG